MTIRERYLELLKRSLLNELYPELEAILHYFVLCRRDGSEIDPAVVRDIARARPDLMAGIRAARTEGSMILWPSGTADGTLFDPRNLTEHVHTMIGRKRLDHLHHCLDAVLREGIPGDLIETGVWRGGATIFMRAHLLAHGVEDRTVWVADSFQGVPPPSCAEDEGIDLSAAREPILAIDQETVAALFRRYGVLDARVRFLPGWFRDTLPTAPVERLALLRLDGDLFESTMDALTALYDRVSPGGFVVIDDYGAVPGCRRAVEEFRADRAIDAPLETIDWGGVVWRKPTDAPATVSVVTALSGDAPIGADGAIEIPDGCLFYHSISLPGREVRGQWDLRPRTADYLGNVAFDGRSVLEIGPASGYLSFHMEAAGAHVTCVEPTMDRLWDIVPLAGFDTETWRREFVPHIVGVRKSFWFLHRLYGSSVRVVEAEPYDLPDDLGQFDVGVLTSVLLHCRHPFSLIQSVGRHVSDTMIITEIHDPALGDDAACRFLPHRGGGQVHTWWQFTPRYFVSVLEVLGFPRTTVTHHTQWSETSQAAIAMFTVVGRR